MMMTVLTATAGALAATPDGVHPMASVDCTADVATAWLTELKYLASLLDGGIADRIRALGEPPSPAAARAVVNILRSRQDPAGDELYRRGVGGARAAVAALLAIRDAAARAADDR